MILRGLVLVLMCSAALVACETTTIIPEDMEEEEIISTTVLPSSAENMEEEESLVAAETVVEPKISINASENSILSLHDRTYEYIKKYIPDLSNDLDTWEPPLEFQTRFPYYLSGYDDEDRPIWMAECGKYDARPLLDKGGKEALALMDKFMQQVAYRMIRSILERGATQGVGLMDFDGLQISQFIHPPTLAFLLKSARAYYHLILKHMGGVLVINANYPTEVFVNIMRPVLGPILEKVDIHGNEKSKWLPHVRRMFPQSTVPSWYGGNKQFKPVEVYG